MKKVIPFIFFFSLVWSFACNNSNRNDSSMKRETRINSVAKIDEHQFGTYENQSVTEYALVNASGMQVVILNYGGIVRKLLVPDRNGILGDVVLGYSSFEGYLQKNNPYFGAIVGRFANRIANAQFTLDGQSYSLAANDYGNSLHGGNTGFDKVIWAVEKLGDSSLKLKYRSKDGEEGYPGNLDAQVIYTLHSDNSLQIDYSASTDKPTPVNLTNHSYFNLSAGRDSTILDHELEINADKFTPVNDQLIPTGKFERVAGTPMDFGTSKAIGKDIAQVKGGYDHNWVLNSSRSGLHLAAKLYEPGSGRYMEVYTTQPGIQFYTGNFLDGTLRYSKNGTKYVQHGALCLETQHFPDSPNQPSFPNSILRPGEIYKHTTVFKFSTR